MTAMHSLFLLALLAPLSACSSLGEESHSLFSETLPGLSDFDTITKQDREDAAWWDRFYGGGGSSGSSAKSGSGSEGLFSGHVDSSGPGTSSHSTSDSGASASSSSSSDSSQ